MLNHVWSLNQWEAPAPPDKFTQDAHNHVALLSRQVDFDCLMLGSFGLKTRVIADYTGLTASQVVYRLKKAKIRISDFREGHGPFAAMVLEGLKRRAAKQVTQQVRQAIDI
ncbi:MAG TPA: hypothetical protein VH598_15710 [Verrucomicrobiae bacterium]|jgi:hypothetical protein|nr:hypothetical protein [Verrucomicrobiae bacterium]